MSLTPESDAFDYSALDDGTRTAIQSCTRDIKSLMVKTVQQIVTVGQRLHAVKQKLKHGQFLQWLKSELDMSPRQARRFMLIATQFKVDRLANLAMTPTALYLLAELQTPELARQEAISRSEQGENITLGIAKEIVSRHKALVPKATVNRSQSLLRKRGDGRTINTSNIGKGLAFNKLTSKAKEPSDQIDAPIEHSLNLRNNGEENLFPIIDITAETIEDGSKSPQSLMPADPQPKQSQIPHSFEIGDRVRIIRRQNGQDKWSGYIANVGEITVDGWLRVAIEEKTGVRFTLHPDWVELFEETVMTEPANTAIVNDSASFPQEEQLLVRIPLEIGGSTIEVDGVIHDVEVHYTHQGIHGSVRVPANLIFPKPA